MNSIPVACRRVLATIFVALCCCNPDGGFGQLVTIGHRGAFLSATEQSDPIAISAINSFVESTGGRAMWEKMTAARVSIEDKVDDPAGITSNVELVEEWSQDIPRYRRKISGQVVGGASHDGKPYLELGTGDKKVTLREIDSARLLVDHLPTVSALEILRRTDYVVKVSTRRPCPSTFICVDIFRRLADQGLGTLDQEWDLNRDTKKLSDVRLRIEGASFRDSSSWRRIHFESYELRSGYYLPSSTRISRNNVQDRRQTVIGVEEGSYEKLLAGGGSGK